MRIYSKGVSDNSSVMSMQIFNDYGGKITNNWRILAYQIVQTHYKWTVSSLHPNVRNITNCSKRVRNHVRTIAKVSFLPQNFSICIILMIPGSHLHIHISAWLDSRPYMTRNQMQGRQTPWSRQGAGSDTARSERVEGYSHNLQRKRTFY